MSHFVFRWILLTWEGQHLEPMECLTLLVPYCVFMLLLKRIVTWCPRCLLHFQHKAENLSAALSFLVLLNGTGSVVFEPVKWCSAPSVSQIDLFIDFGDKVSFCSLSCTRTPGWSQNFCDPPASTSWLLETQVCPPTSTPAFKSEVASLQVRTLGKQELPSAF